MISYDFYPEVIVRIPSWPVSKTDMSLDMVLADSTFRAALYLASDDLYAEVSKCNFQADLLSERAIRAITKYHKRMCYRPTPFGAFSAVGIIEPDYSLTSEFKIIKGSMETVSKQGNEVQLLSPAGELMYIINPSIYRFGDDYRIYQRKELPAGCMYTITELYGSRILRKLWKSNGLMTKGEIEMILRKAGVEESELEMMFQELIENQVIYAGRVIDCGAVSEMILPLPPPEGDRDCGHPPKGDRVAGNSKRGQRGERILPLPPPEGDRDCGQPTEGKTVRLPGSAYNAVTRVRLCGSMSPKVTKQLNEGLYCLSKLAVRDENSPMSEFKKRFSELFDRREIPLLQALDPELGIDYLDLSSGFSKSSNLPNTQRTQLQSFFLRKLEERSEKTDPIVILDKDLNALEDKTQGQTRSTAPNLPPGAYTLYSICGDQIYLKAAGGVSGLNLIGRFTSFDDRISVLARKIAEGEKANNPDVLFAELVHSDGQKSDKVSNRDLLFDAQIVFSSRLGSGKKLLIPLSDLMISMHNGILQLRSPRLNKRIIPRLSCAYNYRISTLPPFLFLSDLQYEGIDPVQNISLPALLPGLSFYPRIVYRQTILDTASWHIDAAAFRTLYNKSSGQRAEAFLQMAVEIGLPEQFCFEDGDRLLHVNLKKDRDINTLITSLPRKGNLIFREYLMSQEELVTDANGNPYAHELISVMRNPGCSYPGGLVSQTAAASAKSGKEKNKLLPFDEWFYIKLYLHPVGFRNMLKDYVIPFVQNNLRHGYISSWYFLSYFDTDHHLRIRLRIPGGKDEALLRSYTRLERQLRKLPNLRKLELSTYFPELERYAAIGKSEAEELFALSSCCRLESVMVGDIDETPLLIHAIRHILALCESCEVGLTQVLCLSEQVSASIPATTKVEFDLEYRSIRQEIIQGISKRMSLAEHHYITTAAMRLKGLSETAKIQLLHDLTHMHLNRHFLSEPVRLESKTWYFTSKVAAHLLATGCNANLLKGSIISAF